MANIKRQTAKKVATKAFLASRYASDNRAQDIMKDTAKNLSRGKAKNAVTAAARRNLSNPTKAEYKAAQMMQKQRATELGRSATRAASVEKKAKAKAEITKLNKALRGSGKKK
jgi:predicted XRE-type DNA-binding protein